MTPLLLLAVTLAGPTLDRGEQAWTLANEHLKLTFDRTGGGWLTGVADAAGRRYVQGGWLYTDHGLFDGRRMVTTRYETQPQMAAESGDGAVTVTAAGTLRPAPNDPPADGLRYELRATLADGPEIRLRWRLTTAVDRPEAQGFLAVLWDCPGVDEWYADTVDGRLNELAEGDGRCYQSAISPLDPERPELGFVYPDGRRLLVRAARAVSGPLSNLFCHHSGHRMALFAANLDGARAPVAWPAGTTWETELTLVCMPAG